jgi:hypothetical protein
VYEMRGEAMRRELRGSYVEGWLRPKTWPFEMSGPVARRELIEVAKSIGPADD